MGLFYMSPHMQELLSTYGYWLMLFGALIEGEIFLIAEEPNTFLYKLTP